jgi:Na+-transporting methylmalonyl-CoA/oxaloacetate decarboxylase gamma subunit
MRLSLPFLFLKLSLLVTTWTVRAFVPTSTSFTTGTLHQQPKQPLRQVSLQALEDLASQFVMMDGSSNAGSVITLSSVDSLTGFDPTVLGVGAVVAFLVFVVVTATGDSSKSETATGSSNFKDKSGQVEAKAEPVDLSVPYNAAALLAYQQVFTNGKETDDEFVTFQQMYKEIAVAQVILNRKRQQVQALEQAFAIKYPPTTTTAATAVNGVVQEPQTA